MSTTTYVVSVEDESGTQYVLGPYTDRAEAEIRAEQHKHTLRLAAWKADGEHGHPDDPPVFAWVVELLPDGPPEHNPYEDAPLVVVSDEAARDAAAGLIQGHHAFVPADGDPGHCAICGEYDNDHHEHTPGIVGRKTCAWCDPITEA